MLTAIHPKLPMRNKTITKAFYTQMLGFDDKGDYDNYLILCKDNIELHLFEHTALNPTENYGQVYIRVTHIAALYQSYITRGVAIHPAGQLSTKPWGQKEFAILDPDNNLLTFGENIL